MMEVQVQRSGILLILLASIASLACGVEEASSSAHLIPCEEGWYLFGGKCYKVFGQENPLKWMDATKVCQSLGGNLVAIKNKEVQDFITVFLMLNKRSDVWIGLNNQRKKWSDDSFVNYTNWLPAESRTKLSTYETKCVRMVFKQDLELTGMWDDLQCNQKLPYICQMDETEQAENRDPRLCSEERGGGLEFSNSCYHIVTKEEKWNDAENYCQYNFNGHLVTILNSEAEMFLNYVTRSYHKLFWIGIKIRDHEIQKWSSRWHVVFNRWGDEKDLVKGFCGVTTRHKHWISDNCTKNYSFICETSRDKVPVYKPGAEGWRCPNQTKEWKDFDGHFCYLFEIAKSRNWYEANYDCMTKGGALAKIFSEEESGIIHQYIKNTQERLLIGLHRNLNDKNTFEWIDGSEIDYENWDVGEPNDAKEECSELYTSSMKWNDIPCTSAKGYICSAEKLPPILYEENIPVPDLQIEKCQQKSDTTGITLLVTSICIFIIIFIIIGIVICSYKKPCGKDIRFSSLRDFNLIHF